MKTQPKLDVSIYLRAAELVDAEASGCGPGAYACNAINHVAGEPSILPCSEREFFQIKFDPAITMGENWFGAFFSYENRFGDIANPKDQKKWRVQALLLCYHLAVQYNRNRH
jgi:hypothetical protein